MVITLTKFPMRTTRRLLRHLSWVPTAAFGAAACVPLPHGHEVSSRRVVSKLNGDTFVAEDGSLCRVPEATYKKLATGTDHVCIWKKGPAGLTGGGSRSIPSR